MRHEGKSLVRQCRKAKRNVASPPGTAAIPVREVFRFEPLLCKFIFEALLPATL